jgi:hypothetical protein
MILDDIIGILSDESSSISEALLKTKILLHQIGKKELTQWVNNELNGYPRDDDVLPAYGILPSHVKGNVANLARRYESFPIPIGHLNAQERKHLDHAYMFESLAVLEDMSKRAIQGNVSCPIPMEYNGRLGETLDKSYHVENAWCQVAAHDIKGIAAHIRSRLLDFLLELKDNIGNTSNEAELRQKTRAFDAMGMFNNTIFGSNTTILIGDHSSITGNQTISGSALAERVRTLVEQVDRLLPASDLPSNVQEDCRGALAELRDAATAATPDVTRLRRGLESLRHIMEHAVGHVVATGALALIGELLSRAAQ